MFDPISTYRVQLNKEFTFNDLTAVIPYLDQLGVKTIYASPIYQAAPHSMHGYDVVDPNRINPEIGTLEELRAVSSLLKSKNMNWIQDIVPNHMGFHQDNAWLMDVLKKGESSAFRKYFDIVSKDLSDDPLMVPFLGETLENAVANEELHLVKENEDYFFEYYGQRWPVKMGTVVLQDLDAAGLLAIASQQHYRLCHHGETNTKINYRRFFTVNSLICVNIQDNEVFRAYHQLTHALVAEGIFQGLRIDHVDGLADPTAYLQQLRELCGKDTYIVVEKILELGEILNRDWPIEGSTGYDFLGQANQLMTNRRAEHRFDEFYQKLEGNMRPVQEQIYNKKRDFLAKHMQGELNNLDRLLHELKLFAAEEGQFDFKPLIAELLVRFPVYRFYSSRYPLLPEESEALGRLFDDISKDDHLKIPVTLMKNLLMNGQYAGPAYRERILIFLQRLMQFTGPLMAKGVEDTLMYTYNRFIGNNEVGDSPEMFGISAEEFHEQMLARQREWPLTMNATATHDTKRGEDARSRLAVLTDLRQEWITEVKHWQAMNADLKKNGTPDANDEYFIYQTMIATCPGQNPADDRYPQRLAEYIEKALRESKRNSEWAAPDLDYEEQTKAFIEGLLDVEGTFWPIFYAFMEKVIRYGQLTSLCSVLLKHTLPGVPDTYQGTEFWDLSLVDPDNRRRIDYKERATVLDELIKGKPGLENLWADASNGHIKLHLLQRLLHTRQQHADLFSKGQYIPLAVKGKHSGKILAYARRYRSEWMLVALPLNMVAIADPAELHGADWGDTRIVLPAGISGTAVDVVSERPLQLPLPNDEQDIEWPTGILFREFPLAAVLVGQDNENTRGAGILMHISSLPSAYGAGDCGNSAREFLHMLADSGLKYWQILPLNPVSPDQSFSPYSANSVMAGNTLMISLEDLAGRGLLTLKDLERQRQRVRRNVDYQEAAELKNKLLEQAYQTWLSAGRADQRDAFTKFTESQNDWLEDYAFFELLKVLQNGKPWYEWPADFKNRDRRSLDKLKADYALKYEEIKWRQYQFFNQWSSLRAYANVLNIQIIGDLPYYTALDSADVWAHQHLFAIDAEGTVKGAAGVPPDYFNADGQLWGMPVYNWTAMAEEKYSWWTMRIAKNMELFDLIRLDHFRAFSAYWEVSGDSDTAKKGSWKPAPGAELLKVLKEKFGKIPFIAEDLGEITAEVYQLRDDFELPGMKVLQFAFGEDSAASVHSPHNYGTTNCIVYTGTHDNNTTRGWYEEDADTNTKKRIDTYMGIKVNRQNIVMHMIRLALGSTAKIAVIPIQDLLNRPAKHRMNTPASVDDNWTWRLKPYEMRSAGRKIRGLLKVYGR